MIVTPDIEGNRDDNSDSGEHQIADDGVVETADDGVVETAIDTTRMPDREEVGENRDSR